MEKNPILSFDPFVPDIQIIKKNFRKGETKAMAKNKEISLIDIISNMEVDRRKLIQKRCSKA